MEEGCCISFRVPASGFWLLAPGFFFSKHSHAVAQLEHSDQELKHDARIACQALNRSMGSEEYRRSVLELFGSACSRSFRRFSDEIVLGRVGPEA